MSIALAIYIHTKAIKVHHTVSKYIPVLYKYLVASST